MKPQCLGKFSRLVMDRRVETFAKAIASLCVMVKLDDAKEIMRERDHYDELA